MHTHTERYGQEFRKSSYSTAADNCVEVSEGSSPGVRDTQNRRLATLFFSADEWQAFLDTTRTSASTPSCTATFF